LLGQLVGEIQKMSKKLDGLQVQASDQGTAGGDAQGGEAGTGAGATEDTTPPEKSRAEKYGIEALGEEPQEFADGAPQDFEKYGDPVNLKYPIDSAEAANSSRTAFKKESGQYKEDKSKAAVHERIVAAQLALGADPSFDEKDALDAMLSNELKGKLAESNAKALDSYRKRLENVSTRLAQLGM
jgi:hypothetical protein